MSADEGFTPRPAVDLVTGERPPSVDSEWILRNAFGASLDLQWEDLHVMPSYVSVETRDVDPSALTQDDKPRSLAGEDDPIRGAKLPNMSVATSIDALGCVAKLLGPSVMPRFLGKLVISIVEIPSLLNDNGIVIEAGELARRLHNLAGSAGTLGCGALSGAARDLEYNRSGSGQAQQNFTEIARATITVIDAYIAGLSDPVTELPSTRSPHVLIVDDTEMYCEIAKAFLRGASLNVTCVHGGRKQSQQWQLQNSKSS